MLMGTKAGGSVRVSQRQVGRSTGVVNGRLLDLCFPIVVICVSFNILEMLSISAAGLVWK